MIRNILANTVCWFAIALVVLMCIGILSGCTTTSGLPEPTRPYCNSCIGPYDVTLSSHRQALGLEP